MRLRVILVLTLFASIALADVIDEWIEASPQREELSVWLSELSARPLNLNSATAEEISQLPFIDIETAGKLVELRDTRGGFESMGDALGAKFLSQEEKLSLQRFATHKDYQDPRGRVRTAAHSTTEQDEVWQGSEVQGRFRGDFAGSRGQEGFLFGVRRSNDSDILHDVSAGIRIPSRGNIPLVVLGDFQYEFGTGLVFASAFGTAAWISSQSVRAPKARGIVFKPTSARLARFRGGAVSWQTGKLSFDALGSIRELDAAVDSNGVTKLMEGTSSSIDLLLARRNQIEEMTAGSSLRYQSSEFELGFAGMHSEFSPGIKGDDNSDLKQFSGDGIDAGSIYVRGTQNNLSPLAEFAVSNRAIAYQTAVSVTQSRLRWMIYNSHADADYIVTSSKVWGGFGEDAGNADETGIRATMNWSRQQFSISASLSESPFRTSTSTLSKRGSATELRWQYSPSANTELSLLAGRSFREETSESNPSATVRTDRLRVESVIHGNVEYKFRIEVKSAKKSEYSNDDLGTLLFAQGRSPIGSVQFFARVTVFNFESSDAAIGAYENSLYGDYPFVTLSGTGRRAAVMLSREFDFVRLGLKTAITSSTAHETAEIEGGAELYFIW